MSAIIKLVAPGELLLQPRTEEKHPSAIEKENAVQRPSSIGEPEQRLWKLSTHAPSPKSAIIEVLVLVLFLALALAATIDCFAELSRLLQSDAIEHGMKTRGSRPFAFVQFYPWPSSQLLVPRGEMSELQYFVAPYRHNSSVRGSERLHTLGRSATRSDKCRPNQERNGRQPDCLRWIRS